MTKKLKKFRQRRVALLKGRWLNATVLNAVAERVPVLLREAMHRLFWTVTMTWTTKMAMS